MQAALAAVCFGQAQFVDDEPEVRKITERIELRYLGAVPPEFEQALFAELDLRLQPIAGMAEALQSSGH